MELIVDLHVHSHYSRATSKDSTLEGLYKWGKIKGITVIGTGDFTHPDWFAELQEKLEPAEDGLFTLKKEFADEIDKMLPESIQNGVIRFILTVEISCIYFKNGKVRKVHNLIILPHFKAVEEFNSRLSKIGNLKADGRPILGMDAKNLLKLSLDIDPDSLFIPAHIWTPWFGIFGSKSGFDSLEEAFEELAPEVHAVETGLSSDPFMNWRLKELQNRTITSHSDAHSPPKLGREATIVNCALSYKEIVNAIKTNDRRLIGTIEFFPEEGKYHSDGHRACGIRFSPEETEKHNSIYPVCDRPVTVGVEYRVGKLANESLPKTELHNKTVEYIIPLIEIISELKGTGTASKKVQEEYKKVYTQLGNEFSILRKMDCKEIKKDFPELSFAIEKMRKKEVYKNAGYDGIYGTIKIFKKGESIGSQKQMSLL